MRRRTQEPPLQAEQVSVRLRLRVAAVGTKEGAGVIQLAVGRRDVGQVGIDDVDAERERRQRMADVADEPDDLHVRGNVSAHVPDGRLDDVVDIGDHDTFKGREGVGGTDRIQTVPGSDRGEAARGRAVGSAQPRQPYESVEGEPDPVLFRILLDRVHLVQDGDRHARNVQLRWEQERGIVILHGPDNRMGGLRTWHHRAPGPPGS